MDKIVECVPKFFRRRKDKQIIDAIAGAIAETPGCSLLDVDPGKSTKRTVSTFVADPERIVTGALAAARMARGKMDA